MRKLAQFALAGAAAAALAGTAYAATGKAHVMDVALPDGAVAHIQYYGDVAPKVTIAAGDRGRNARLVGSHGLSEI